MRDALYKYSTTTTTTTTTVQAFDQQDWIVNLGIPHNSTSI